MRLLLASGLLVSGLVGTGWAGSVTAAPALPDTVPPVADRHAEAAEADDDGEPASPKGRAKRAAALAFVEEMKDWTACVRDAAPAHDESTGEFDPTAACGRKPTPPTGRDRR